LTIASRSAVAAAMKVADNDVFAEQAFARAGSGLADAASRANPQARAIALSHPLGTSGARVMLAAASAVDRGGHALTTPCVGVAYGVAGSN
jgi:acetyl-CoA acetyltransferase